MCEYASKMFRKIQTFWAFVKSIRDEEYFAEMIVGPPLHNLSKFYDMPYGFVPSPPF